MCINSDPKMLSVMGLKRNLVEEAPTKERVMRRDLNIKIKMGSGDM